MNRKFLFFIIILFSISLNSKAQCLRPDTTFETNVYYYSANLNWSQSNSSYNYKIRYKEINSGQWLYKNNIDSVLNNKTINNLLPQETYIWQIRNHCDSLNLNTSSWTPADSFVTSTNLCPSPNNLNTNNITYFSAQANWNILNNADRYRVHYRILNTNNWQNLNIIDGVNNNVLIPVLQQNTTYEWEIMAYHDSTLNMGSLWSIADTFTTQSFIPAPFNPVVNSALQNNQCNTASGLSVTIEQTQDQPDIGTSTITTDGGYFDIQSINSGDSVGYANLNSTNQNIETVLRAGLIVGPNYAIINSYDTSNSLIGFFAIENISSGVRVSTTSPNDGNNYTSGYTSEINFTNLFINPNINGDLNIVTELESEFNEQLTFSNTFFISCPSNINEGIIFNEIKKTININGIETEENSNQVIIYLYKDGRTEKKLIIE